MLTVEIKTNQMRKTKFIHSELTRARESATITGILAVTQRPAEEQESSVVGKKGRLLACRPDWTMWA